MSCTSSTTAPEIGQRTRSSRPTPNGYELGDTLGRGGMGEVVLARDKRIGREVAIKLLNDDVPGDEVRARFLREAMIQARLEHPAIVPVHEIGRDDDGRPYFTMKRIAGCTLGERIADPRTSLQRLLRVLVDVCLAIEYAHARAVIHRDLKPSNIMIGDFGEVYVLDWGIARVIGDDDVIRGGSLGDGATTSELLGTPGYAAPEQVMGATDLGPPADVYALGAILFEILTRRPLHPRGKGAARSTITTPAQDPGVVPELDAVCVAALARDPSVRPTARTIATLLEAYLDGDRDVARRRELAADQLAIARAALASGDGERRGEAMRAAGRALALDPESEAAALVAVTVCEVPVGIPARLAGQLHAVETDLAARAARGLALARAAYLLFLPIVVAVGISDPVVVAGMFGLVGVLAIYSLQLARTKRKPSIVSFVGEVVLALLLERMFGPIVVVPAIVVAVGVLSTRAPELIDRPRFLVGVAALSFLLPLVLEGLGLLASTWSVAGDTITIHSAATGFSPFYLIAVNLALIIVATIYGWSLAAQRRDAQQRFEIQAWHLRQLLPS